MKDLTNEELEQLQADTAPGGYVSWEGEPQERVLELAPRLVAEVVRLRAMRAEVEREIELGPSLKRILARSRGAS